MVKYFSNTKEVKKALKTGRFGNLQWQAICARPEVAKRIIEENERISRFLESQTGLNHKNSVINGIIKKG